VDKRGTSGKHHWRLGTRQGDDDENEDKDIRDPKNFIEEEEDENQNEGKEARNRIKKRIKKRNRIDTTQIPNAMTITNIFQLFDFPSSPKRNVYDPPCVSAESIGDQRVCPDC